jgi:hypothetical protein
MTLSASFIVLDPLAPSSIGGAAMPVTTTIAAPAPLVLTQVSPLTAPPGASILVTGFGIQPGAIVSVGGAIAPITSLSATSITFTNPPGQQCDTNVAVLNPDGQFATTLFNPAPLITGILNGSGPAAGGTSVGILGNLFLPGTFITIGGSPAAITFQTPTLMFCTTPPGMPGPASIVVSSASPCTALSTFNYQ